MHGDSIDLIFTNRSYDPKPPKVVIYQGGFSPCESPPIAWKVIENCRYDNWHPFRLSAGVCCRLQDVWGNRSPQIEAPPGSRLLVEHGPSGRPMLSRECIDDGTAVTVTNKCPYPVDGIEILREQRLVACGRCTPAGRRLAFESFLTIHIAPVLRVEEGQPIDLREVIGTVATFSLEHVRRGEIVMMGGGMGASAQPLSFALMDAS